MADMNERVELNYLLDFYGPLLTEHRQEVMRLYCEEDLTQQEIADQLSITRQGVFDTLAKAKRQLAGCEKKLGLVRRHRMQTWPRSSAWRRWTACADCRRTPKPSPRRAGCWRPRSIWNRPTDFRRIPDGI